MSESRTRHTADTITDDALDELYDNASRGRRRGDRWKAKALEEQSALAEVLGIVSAWCVEANEVGGVDATDLAFRLAEAGHQLPDEETTAPADRTRGVLDEVHADGTGSKTQQDSAEASRKWCQDAFASGYGTWSDVLAEEVAEANAERAPARLRTELVQVAAVAAAWIEAIDRRAAAPAEGSDR